MEEERGERDDDEDVNGGRLGGVTKEDVAGDAIVVSLLPLT